MWANRSSCGAPLRPDRAGLVDFDAWLVALAGELRRYGVDSDLAAQVIAEAAGHLRSHMHFVTQL
jgi:hypothetical protein